MKSIIIKSQLVRRFTYSNDQGIGYISPLLMNFDENENELYEVEVEGECKCCFECINNDDCVHGICDDNICMECRNDEDCGNGNGNVCILGKCGMDMEGLCQNDDDCKNEEICKDDGICVERFCVNDENCENNEICDWNGNCIEGCKNDGDCKKGEICFGEECSNGLCRDNFDCNDYEHVCINNQCVFVGENSGSCVNDVDCSVDYYCDYEYFICIKKRKETVLDRRKGEVLPIAACSVIGMVSVFVMTTSYTIATNIAKDKLLEKCNIKCAQRFSNVDAGVQSLKTRYDELLVKRRKNFEKPTECFGNCRNNLKLKDYQAINYALEYCETKKFGAIIIHEQKLEYLKYTIEDVHEGYVAFRIFEKMLRNFCVIFHYEYLHTKSYYIHKREKLKKLKICSEEPRSIVCKGVENKYGRYQGG